MRKKLVTAWCLMIIVGSFLPFTISAQSTEPQTDQQKEIMITLLLQIIELLKQQIALIQAQQAQTPAPVQQIPSAPTPEPVSVGSTPQPEDIVASKIVDTVGSNCGQVIVSVAVKSGSDTIDGREVVFTNPETGATTTRTTVGGKAIFSYVPQITSGVQYPSFTSGSLSNYAIAHVLPADLQLLKETAGRQIDPERGVCL